MNVYMLMNVCVYYMNICARIYMYALIHVYFPKCMCMCGRISVCTYEYVYIY